MSAAQEEFNQLVQNSREISSSHPEDRDSHSPAFSDEDSKVPSRSNRHPDSSDEDEAAPNMVSSTNYHIPKHTFEANTGPKGVIADAQAFERARKKSFRRTLLSAAGLDNAGTFAAKASREESPRRNRSGSPTSSDDDEDRFMRKWRASRMQELQSRSNRQSSPRGRVYGRVDNVDAAGYLDAIEKVTPDAVVVVCIYDPENDESAIVEECLNTVSRRKPYTHFVKLHHEIAEMSHIQAPALLAYRGGDVFATITDVIRNIPRGRPCSADSLEDLLKMHRVL